MFPDSWSAVPSPYWRSWRLCVVPGSAFNHNRHSGVQALTIQCHHGSGISKEESLLSSAKDGKHQSNLFSPSNGVCCHSNWLVCSVLNKCPQSQAYIDWGLNLWLGEPMHYCIMHICNNDNVHAQITGDYSVHMYTMTLSLSYAHTHTHTQIAFKRLPSCDQKAFRCYPPMNIKYKHSSKFSTPGPYFKPLSWNNKHISFSLPNSAPKMNLSLLYKIICQHYMCRWIIHNSSWKDSAPSDSWRKRTHGWQTHWFYSWGSIYRRRFCEKKMTYSPWYLSWKLHRHVWMKMNNHLISELP